MIIQFGPWRPDVPALANPGVVEATNVVPQPGAYQRQAGLSEFTSSLGARCQGAFVCLDSGGNVNWFAGDISNLYRINVQTTGWSVVSRVALYSTASTEWWSFAQFGDLVYATNYSDEMQRFSLGGVATFGDVTGAPKCRYLGVVNQFLVAVNVNDDDGVRPHRVRWSAIGNADSWTVAAVTQADFVDLAGESGGCQGIVAGLAAADAAIIQEHGIQRMTYVGPPLVFSFDLVEGVRGTPAPGSIVQSGGFIYYLGEDGFYQFDGARSYPIGNGKVDQTFFADVDTSAWHRIRSVIDVGRKLIFWAYVSTSSSDGNPDRIMVYNWETSEWSRLELSVEELFRTISLGYTLEELDSFTTNIEALTPSMDSRQWTGGILQLSAFTTGHRTAHFTGAPLAATIVSGEQQMAPGGRATLVTQVWPFVKHASPRISVGHRNRTIDPVVFEAATDRNAIGFCPQRVYDRFMRFRMSISAGETWSDVQGIEVFTADRGIR